MSKIECVFTVFGRHVVYELASDGVSWMNPLWLDIIEAAGNDGRPFRQPYFQPYRTFGEFIRNEVVTPMPEINIIDTYIPAQMISESYVRAVTDIANRNSPITDPSSNEGRAVLNVLKSNKKPH